MCLARSNTHENVGATISNPRATLSSRVVNLKQGHDPQEAHRSLSGLPAESAHLNSKVPPFLGTCLTDVVTIVWLPSRKI